MFFLAQRMVHPVSHDAPDSFCPPDRLKGAVHAGPDWDSAVVYGRGAVGTGAEPHPGPAPVCW